MLRVRRRMNHPNPPRAVSPDARVRPRVLPLWLPGVYAVLAWVALLVLPSEVPTVTTDAGWRAVLHHAAIHGWQFGTEVVFTYGPLGYLQCASQYHAGTFLGCIVYQGLFKALYVALLVRLARRLPRDAAAAFLLANTLLPLLDEDSIYLLTFGYGGLALQGRTRADRYWSLPVLASFATAALMKETFLVYGVFTVACTAASLGVAKRRGRGASIVGGFVVCFLAAYLWPGGQDLRNLPAFLQRGWEIVGGYPAAMAVRPPNAQFVAGCVLVLGLVWWRLAAAAFFRGDVLASNDGWPRQWLVFLVLSAGLFLAWKAGFTRTDPNHCMTFFAYLIAIDAAGPVFFPATDPARPPARAAYAVPLLTAWIVFQYPSWAIKENTPLAERIAANLHWLLAPDWQRGRLDALTQQEAAKLALPRCRAAVGEATIDLFGCAQAVLLDGGYNYRPAPVFQPYSAYTPGLIALNAAFYRSERAPEFVLFKPEVIDGRLPTLEDAPVLTWLLRRYRPVLAERGALLLRREDGSPNDPGPAQPLEPLAEGELTAGQALLLPPTDGAIWCELDWRPTGLGRLAGLVFQPPYAELDVSTAGQAAPATYRVVPAMARAGFLLSPVVASAADFLHVLAGGDQPLRPTAVAIHPAGAFRGLMQERLRYRLYPVPPFAVPAEAPSNPAPPPTLPPP